MNTQSAFAILFLSLPVAVVSITITKASVFERLRQWVQNRNQWFGKLITCPYCTSHWVSFALVAFYRPRVVQSGWWPIDLAASAFALVAIATPISFVIYRSFRQLEPASNGEEVGELRGALAKAKGIILEQREKLQSAGVHAKTSI